MMRIVIEVNSLSELVSILQGTPLEQAIHKAEDKTARDKINEMIVRGELVASDVLGFHPEAHNMVRQGKPVLCYVLKEDIHD